MSSLSLEPLGLALLVAVGLVAGTIVEVALVVSGVVMLAQGVAAATK